MRETFSHAPPADIWPVKIETFFFRDGNNEERVFADWPMLVTFRDVRDPTSVERVDPAALDKSFGPGVRLRRITVAVTDDPVTTGIEKRLGWLPKFWDRMLDGSKINNSQALANNLASDSFSTEVRP